MGDKSSSDELSEHDSEIGGNGVHSVFEILGQTFSVLG
jgi:hypothetical protein